MTIDTKLAGTIIGSNYMQVQNQVSLWRIKREDGTLEFYTSHDEDLRVPVLINVETGVNGINSNANFGVVTFLATSGLTLSASRRESGLRSQTISAEGVLGIITLDNVEGRLYEMAELQEWIVDWRWPFIRHFATNIYWITKVSYSDEEFDFHCEGHGRRVRENLGHPFTRTCRWTLGRDDFGVAGKGCGEDRSAKGGIHLEIVNFRWINCAVNGVAVDLKSSNRMAFNLLRAGSSRDPASTLPAQQVPLGRPFKHGVITWTVGLNTGLSYEIGDYNESLSRTGETGQFVSTIIMPHEIQIGDKCTIEEGCDNSFDTCFTIYGNQKNFGGWHLIPGPTRAGQSPRIRWS